MKNRLFGSRVLLFRVLTSRPALFLVGGILLAFLPGQKAAGAPHDNPLAYVTVRDATPKAGAVSVINAASNQVITTVPVGPGPNGMTVTSDGKRGYVANYGIFPGPFAQATSLSNTVSVIQLVPLERNNDHQNNPKPHVVATVTVGWGPLGVAVTPDDEEVYVTNFGQDATLVPGAVEGNTVSVIRTRSNKVVATITGGKSSGWRGYQPRWETCIRDQPEDESGMGDRYCYSQRSGYHPRADRTRQFSVYTKW